MAELVNLDSLNDMQKSWLCDLSYVDITLEGYEKIHREGITIYELKDFIKNPESPFCGDILLGTKRFNRLTEVLLGNEKFPSKLDIINELIKNNLGSLKINHVSGHPKESLSGFQALTFEDAFGNIGISYRGSDLYISHIVIREWLEANIFEYFSNTSTQVNEAVLYFLKHRTTEGNNFIYGHSLGGNLVSHVYLCFYDEIKQAFSMNGTPINQQLINTPEKLQAFNDSERFKFNIVCGDLVAQLKSCEVYKDNVNYIKNNNNMKPSFISAHMIQASTFDEMGNFVIITEPEMRAMTDKITITFANITQITREKMNKLNTKFNLQRSNIVGTIKNPINDIDEIGKKMIR